MVRLVEAELLLNDGDQPGGLEALRIAMSLGATGEFVNTPVWEPQSMSRLCAAALNAGIETDYVRRLIRRRQLTVHPADVDSDTWPWPIKIRTLGRFDVLVDDTPITFPVKAQRRPVALLKALIATGASHVREERLVALLWPEASGDTGQFALTTTLHRVRRLLGLPDAILRQEGRLSLNSQLCWVDSLTLQRLLEQSRAVSSESDESWQQLDALTRRIAQLYSGGFLTDEEDDAAWIATARQQLQTKVIEYVLRVGALAERRDRWLEAAEAYEFGMKVDPCAETVCRRLMLCYSRLGRHSDTQRTFERCRDELRRSLDAHPSPETQSLWNQLRAALTRPRPPA
jgi:DNA-binding SARP family transcriptional activator